MRLQRRRVIVLLMVISIATAACGDSGSGTSPQDPGASTTAGGDTAPPTTDPTGTTAPAATTTTGSSSGTTGCRVQVTGDDPRTFTGPDDQSAVATDYWFTDQELQEQYEFFSVEGDPPFSEVLASGDPVFTLLLMNCGVTTGDTVHLFVSDATRRADFPLGPGTYPILGGVFDATELPPASFSAFYAPSGDSVWGQDGEGELVITRWDGSRIEGSFRFEATERFVEEDRRVEVTGTFSFTCQVSVSC